MLNNKEPHLDIRSKKHEVNIKSGESKNNFYTLPNVNHVDSNTGLINYIFLNMFLHFSFHDVNVSDKASFSNP